MREFTYRYRKSGNPRGELTSESVFDILHLFWEKRRERQLSVTNCPTRATTAFLRHRHCSCCCWWCWCEARCEGHHVFVCSPAREVSITQPTSPTPTPTPTHSALFFSICRLSMRRSASKKWGKKKNLNVGRYWTSRTGPETLRGLLRRSVSKFFIFYFIYFNISLPLDCLMIYYVYDACNHISQRIGLWGPFHVGSFFSYSW